MGVLELQEKNKTNFWITFAPARCGVLGFEFGLYAASA